MVFPSAAETQLGAQAGAGLVVVGVVDAQVAVEDFALVVQGQAEGPGLDRCR